jgi:hypothetical protein
MRLGRPLRLVICLLPRFVGIRLIRVVNILCLAFAWTGKAHSIAKPCVVRKPRRRAYTKLGQGILSIAAYLHGAERLASSNLT